MFHTFKGGIRPPLRKELTGNSSLENLSVPQVCYLPLQQHKGLPAVPVVKAGDAVDEGQLVARAEGSGSANVHASVPGRIVEIRQAMTVYGMQPVIVIEAEGAFGKTGRVADSGAWRDLTVEELVRKVRDAGLVNLDNTGYSSDLAAPADPGKKIDTLIVNCTAVEPYITSDEILIRTHPDEILEGVLIALRILNIHKAVLAVDKTSSIAAEILSDALRKVQSPHQITIKKLKSRYPLGAEKQLVFSTLGRIIKSGQAAADAGVSLHDTATVFALREAVVLDKPLIERYITVSGSMIKTPGNFKVRIGTRIADIAEECGGLKADAARIVMGGPMSGTAVTDMNIPVVKSTTALLFLSGEEAHTGNAQTCIRCGRCVRVCPMGLLPCKIASAYAKNDIARAQKFHPEMCIMCGSCSYICPAQIPLAYLINKVNDTNANAGK